jgi:hypothetical protein
MSVQLGFIGKCHQLEVELLANDENDDDNLEVRALATLCALLPVSSIV